MDKLTLKGLTVKKKRCKKNKKERKEVTKERKEKTLKQEEKIYCGQLQK